jgi:hypothetical protein
MNRFVAAAMLSCCAALVATSAHAAKPARKGAKKAPVEQPLPPAEGEQAAAAALVHYGDYACEFNQTVNVAMNPKHDAYIDVAFGKLRYTMKPVMSSTGAIRLEDVKGQTMMLQIAHKSMLMDVKAGHRLVDDCVHEKQALAKKAYESQPSGGSMLGGEPAAAPAQR